MTRKKTPNPGLAVAYIRVSTDKTRQELGAEAQRVAIERYAGKNGLSVVAHHEDEASGGAPLAARPGLLAALSELRAHGAGVLLIAKRDRFTRDPLETAGVELELRKMGVELVSADGLANGSDPASRLMKAVLEGVAEFEKHTIRNRIKAALAVKKGRGERVGTVPYGFELAPDAKTLVASPGEQETLSLARTLRNQGMKLREVQDALSAEGRFNRHGKAFALPALHKMTSS